MSMNFNIECYALCKDNMGDETVKIKIHNENNKSWILPYQQNFQNDS